MMAGVKEVPLKIGQVRVYLLSVFLLSACSVTLRLSLLPYQHASSSPTEVPHRQAPP